MELDTIIIEFAPECRFAEHLRGADFWEDINGRSARALLNIT